MVESNLAPGVMQNVLTHALAMALLPLAMFFLAKWIGFSGTAAAIGDSIISNITYKLIPKFIVAVIMVHVCLARFIYVAWKEDTSGNGVGGFVKKSD